jgi:hypothetical protein
MFMDQITDQQQEIESPRRSRLTEIILIATTVVVCIILGLFYFDILPIPFKLPNQATKPTPTPKPVAFQYDSAKAKTILTQYIKSAIKPEFLPSKIEIKQGLSIDNRLDDLKNQFGTYYNLKESSISANFHLKENTSIPNDFSIFIQPQKNNQAIVNPQVANSLLSSYFTNPYVVSDCQTKDSTSYCESFKSVNDGKRGYGIVLAGRGSTSALIIFNCFIPKESEEYSTLNSCINY